jgi:hypothetical protein
LPLQEVTNCKQWIVERTHWIKNGNIAERLRYYRKRIF